MPAKNETAGVAAPAGSQTHAPDQGDAASTNVAGRGSIPSEVVKHAARWDMPHTDPRGIAYEVCVAQDFAPDGTDLIAVTEAVIAEHIAEHDAVRDEVIAELARKHENSEAHVEVLMNVNQAFATKCDEHKAERDHAIEGFTPGDVERLQMKARAAIAVADAHDRLDRQAWADEHDGRHVPDQDFENLQAKYEALEAKYIALLRQTLTMKRAKARRKLRTA